MYGSCTYYKYIDVCRVGIKVALKPLDQKVLGSNPDKNYKEPSIIAVYYITVYNQMP